MQSSEIETKNGINKLDKEVQLKMEKMAKEFFNREYKKILAEERAKRRAMIKKSKT